MNSASNHIKLSISMFYFLRLLKFSHENGQFRPKCSGYPLCILAKIAPFEYSSKKLDFSANRSLFMLSVWGGKRRYEDLLTMRLYFLSLFHKNITKGYHSFDQFSYFCNDLLQVTWIHSKATECLGFRFSITDKRFKDLHDRKKSGADPSKKSNRPHNISKSKN